MSFRHLWVWSEALEPARPLWRKGPLGIPKNSIIQQIWCYRRDQCKQWLLLAWKCVLPRLLIIHSVVPQVGARHCVKEDPGCLHSCYSKAPLLLTSLLKPPRPCEVKFQVRSIYFWSIRMLRGWTHADSGSVLFTPANTGSHRRLFWCRDIWF